MLLKRLTFNWLAILLLAITITAQTADPPKLPDSLVGQRVAAFYQGFHFGCRAAGEKREYSNGGYIVLGALFNLLVTVKARFI